MVLESCMGLEMDIQDRRVGYRCGKHCRNAMSFSLFSFLYLIKVYIYIYISHNKIRKGLKRS